VDDSALRYLKADPGALRQAYLDAGGKPSQHDANHNPCPFCGDDSGLSLFEHDGQARWKCWSKCGGTGGTIVDFVMAWQKLGSKDACKVALQKYGRATPAGSAPARAKQSGGCEGSVSGGEASGGLLNANKGKLHLMVDDAIGANIWRMSQDPKNTDIKATKYWHYTDERGEPLFVVVRYDLKRKGDPKKEFAPIRRDGNGWRLGLGPWGKPETRQPDGMVIPAQLCPLYGLPTLVKADKQTLNVVEGEKCADALKALGLVATTSQGGAGRPHETDWRPAASFARVFIWQDIDPAPPEDKEDRRTAGEKYAQSVAELIAKAAVSQNKPCPVITIVDLRVFGLVEGQDVYDLLQTLEHDGKDQTAVLATLAAAVKDGGREWYQAVEIAVDFGGQPKPLTAAPVGLDGRQELCNFELFERPKKNPKPGEDPMEWVPRAQSIDQVMANVQGITGGWPCRVRAPGAKQPLLFADRGEAAAAVEPTDDQQFPDGESKFSQLMPGALVPSRVRWLPGVEAFKAFLHERSRLKLKTKLDAEGANFVECGDLYQSFGGAWGVGEYLAVEVRPHWPPLRGHYYAWTPGKYRPNGDMLRRLLKFFDNCRDDASRAILAAALLTPGWGGRYGARPMIVVTAPDRGYGKSTIAECCAKIWGGHLSINLSGRDEDELLQRLLTPDALTRRVGIIGNVKGTLSSAMLEDLVTCETISGKRLYSGEASRPNTMMYFITANGVKLSRDIALRSYFVNLTKPEYSPQWDEELADFVTEHGRDVIADVGMVFSRPVRLPVTVSDRWPLWRREVLTRACELVRADPDAVMRTILTQRDDCDDDLEEATLFIQGLVEWTVKKYKLITTSAEGLEIVKECKQAIFVTSTEMVEIWPEIMGKKLGAKQIKHIITEHVEAGRLRALRFSERNQANGYELDAKAVQAYLDAYSRRKEAEANAA
jgi:hypothetical protein